MNKKTRLRNEQGFTLIEMAIVLVIIGLILGSVIKGKDVLNSAKQKKFYNAFIKEWELKITTYYDRTGNLLGDGTANGGTVSTKNGQFDQVRGTDGEFTAIESQLKAVGLEVPVTNSGVSYQYNFSGVYSGTTTVNLDLYYLASAVDGRSRNALYIRTIPTDLAIALDTIIDGEANPDLGNFRAYADNIGSWPDASGTPTVNAAYTIDLP